MSGRLAFYNMLACLYVSMCVCLPAYLLHVCLPVFLSRYLSVCLVACLYYLPTCRFPFSQSSCHVYLFYRVFYFSVCWSFLSLILPALLFVYPVSLFCLPVRPSYSVYLPTCAAPLCRPTSLFPLYFDHSSASLEDVPHLSPPAPLQTSPPEICRGSPPSRTALDSRRRLSAIAHSPAPLSCDWAAGGA